MRDNAEKFRTELPAHVTSERIRQVRERWSGLCLRWASIRGKGWLRLAYDVHALQQSFDALGT